jgi:hypothetical protein
MAEQPQRLPKSCPPVHFLAGTVQFAMMRPVQRNGEFVAYRCQLLSVLRVALAPTFLQTAARS